MMIGYEKTEFHIPTSVIEFITRHVNKTQAMPTAEIDRYLGAFMCVHTRTALPRVPLPAIFSQFPHRRQLLDVCFSDW